MIRTAFSVYRSGSTSAAAILSPAWLEIFHRSSGAPAVVVRGGVESGITGTIDCRRAADVQVGDILFETSTWRAFSVVQIRQRPALRQCLVKEILPPIPDEFESGVVEQWWTAAGSFSVLTTGKLNLANGPSASYPSGGSYLIQAVNGDFDFWTKLQSDAGGGATIRHALIGALCNTGGVFVGLKNDGTAKFVRLDEIALGSVTETVSVATPGGALNGFVRFRRIGKFFHTYYSLSLTEPATEQEWLEIAAPVSPFTSLNQASAGPFGYQKTGAASSLNWEWIRNWSS